MLASSLTLLVDKHGAKIQVQARIDRLRFLFSSLLFCWTILDADRMDGSMDDI